MAEHRIYGMPFARIHPMYVTKVERKGRSAAAVDEVIHWLTGYDADGLAEALADERSVREFFARAPRMNPDASLITGVICGVRVEQIEDPLMQRIRWLDKLVDEVARGKAMTAVLRSA